MQSDTITLQLIINSEISLKDKFWFVCKKVNNKKQNQQLAIDIAEIVLPIYEKRYPGDLRVRECIEATKQYIAGHISLEEFLKKRAYAYADAAAAAYAAAAAAYAAAYADADAYAAAYAADAAAYAADAAAEIKQQLFDYLVKHCEQFETELIKG